MTAKGSRKTFLLLADDRPDRASELAEALRNGGYQVTAAATSREVLSAAGHTPKPALILLATDLAEEDCLDLCRRLLEPSETSAIPILLVASANLCGADLQCLLNWADDILLPPFDAVVVQRRVGLLLELAAKRETLQQQAVFLNAEQEERKRVEHELRQALKDLAIAKDRAEESDRLKSVFLAAVSHELRTPMNSIIGFTGILSQGLAGPLNEEQAKQLGIVRRSAENLLALVNDVMDLSKIAAGQLSIDSAQFALPASLENVVRVNRPAADKKGLALELGIGQEVGVLVSDRRRVEQIVSNLVNNAIKFTGKGMVRVECRIDAGWVTIRVIDTGIGIRSEDMPKLFKAFQQIETGIARRYEGKGLGLAICARLTDLLGGTIDVASEWGKGSTFTVRLPAKERAE